MKKAYILSIISILILWQFSSSIIDNELILPSIFDTLVSLFNYLSNINIYIAIIYTLIRCFIAISISFLCALILAIIAYRNKFIEDFLKPILNIIKTIPNIAIIIISLLLVGRSGSIILVIYLVAFPLFYMDMIFSLKNIDHNIIRVTDTYKDDYLLKLRRIYLPLIYPNIMESLLKVVSLSFKVAVMAELIVQVNVGIGHELYFARMNILTSDIFALVIIMISISYLFDFIITKIKEFIS